MPAALLYKFPFNVPYWEEIILWKLKYLSLYFLKFNNLIEGNMPKFGQLIT